MVKKMRRKCGGVISVATEGVVIEVGSDDIKESERIVKGILERFKAPKNSANYIR